MVILSKNLESLACTFILLHLSYTLIFIVLLCLPCKNWRSFVSLLFFHSPLADLLFFFFLRLWPFWLFVAPFPLAWFHVSFFCREKKTWKTMRWCYCSCSFLSHHYLSFTVGAYTHKRNPSSAKDVIFNITCLHLPTRLLRFLFLFFAISLPMFFVWQRRWTHTLKLRF